jgi:hypothetical protein
LYESLEYPLPELFLLLSELLLYEPFVLSDLLEDAGLLYTGAELLPDDVLDTELLLLDPEFLLTALLVPMPLRTVPVLLPTLEEPDDLETLGLLPSVLALMP